MREETVKTCDLRSLVGNENLIEALILRGEEKGFENWPRIVIGRMSSGCAGCSG